jgi:hypothetical protein
MDVIPHLLPKVKLCPAGENRRKHVLAGFDSIENALFEDSTFRYSRIKSLSRAILYAIAIALEALGGSSAIGPGDFIRHPRRQRRLFTWSGLLDFGSSITKTVVLWLNLNPVS